MSENPYKPDPRIGEISKLVDKFDAAVSDYVTYAAIGGLDNEFYRRKSHVQAAREELMKKVRELVGGQYAK